MPFPVAKAAQLLPVDTHTVSLSRQVKALMVKAQSLAHQFPQPNPQVCFGGHGVARRTSRIQSGASKRN